MIDYEQLFSRGNGIRREPQKIEMDKQTVNAGPVQEGVKEDGVSVPADRGPIVSKLG